MYSSSVLGLNRRSKRSSSPASTGERTRSAMWRWIARRRGGGKAPAAVFWGPSRASLEDVLKDVLEDVLEGLSRSPLIFVARPATGPHHRALMPAAPSPPRARRMLAALFTEAAPLDLRLIGRTLLHAAIVGVIAGILGVLFFTGLEVVESLVLGKVVGYGRLT